MKISKSALSLVLALALFGTAACGPQDQEPDAASETPTRSASTTTSGGAGEDEAADSGDTAASGQIVITVENFEYDIPESVSPGATITVVNKDSEAHTVTSKEDGAFDAVFEGGSTVTFTAPEKPGEYPFFCVYHPSMTGTLVVK